MNNNKQLIQAYHEAGKDWFFDKYEAAIIQSNRWFVGFIASTLLSIVLLILLTCLFPLKTLIPLVIHKNTTTGEVWVDQPASPYVPTNEAEVQSDIVRYLTSYLSYTAADINQRFKLVNLLSNARVGKQYAEEQSNNNKLSPVNVLGKDGVRTVRIEDIVFIDKAGLHEIRDFRGPSHNLAKVDLTTTTIDHNGNKKVASWVATMEWVYKGVPSNQQEAWDNWSGFTVTTLRIDPKNIG